MRGRPVALLVLLMLGSRSLALAQGEPEAPKPKKKAAHHAKPACQDAGLAAVVAQLQTRLQAVEAKNQALEQLLQSTLEQNRARDAAQQAAVAAEMQRTAAVKAEVDSVKALEIEQHTTLLPMPRPKSFTIGADAAQLQVTGGEPTIGESISTPAAGSAAITNPTLQGNLNDATALDLSVAYNVDADTAYRFSYSWLNRMTDFGPLSVTGATNGILVPAFGLFGILGTTGNTLVASRNIHYDDMNLERETTIRETRDDVISMLWGVRRVVVEDDLRIGLSSVGPAVTGQNLVRNSHFNATGPSVAVRSRHRLSQRWELQAKAGASALIGKNSVDRDLESTSGGGMVPTLVNSTASRSVFPALDMEGRIVYHATDSLSLHAGFEASRIFDATSQDGFLDSVKQDFSLEGVRAGLDFSFN